MLISECSSVLQGPAGTKGDKGERVSQTTHDHSFRKSIFRPFVEIFFFSFPIYIFILFLIVFFFYILDMWMKRVSSSVHFTIIFLATMCVLSSPLT